METGLLAVINLDTIFLGAIHRFDSGEFLREFRRIKSAGTHLAVKAEVNLPSSPA